MLDAAFIIGGPTAPRPLIELSLNLRPMAEPDASKPTLHDEREIVRRALKEALSDVLDRDLPELADSLTARDIQGWDSLSHLKIIVALESALHIRFDLHEFAAPKDVGEFLDLIGRKLSRTR